MAANGFWIRKLPYIYIYICPVISDRVPLKPLRVNIQNRKQSVTKGRKSVTKAKPMEIHQANAGERA